MTEQELAGMIWNIKEIIRGVLTESKRIIKNLSSSFIPEYGFGFGVRQLE